jgi:predicted permease
MSALRNWLRAAFRHDAMNREMNEEMAQHLEKAVARYEGRGMSRADALMAARREFGNVSVLQEEGREARGASWAESLRADVRYGIRSIRSNAGFATVATLSLAIGIGANTAIFSLINAIALRSLPVEQPGQLVTLMMDDVNPTFSTALFDEVRTRAADIGMIAASGSESFNLAPGGVERLADAEFVSGDYFRVLGVRPAEGRLIQAADDYAGCPRSVVVSYGFWKSELGGRDGAVGSPLTPSDKQYTVLGVAPQGFTGIEVGHPAQLWTPMCTASEQALTSRGYWWLTTFARLAPGQTVESANRTLAKVSSAALAGAANPRMRADRRAEFIRQTLTARSTPGGVSYLRNRYATSLYVLMAMVGVVLLICCANVANLLLARGASRAREMAIRVAIGASRARLIRQLLTESALYAILGGAIGCILAYGISRGLISLIGGSALIDVSLDWRVVAFTMGCAFGTVILCGVIPAWRATKVDPQSTMRSGGGSIGGGESSRLGRMLVVGQCALALIVVTCATLLGGTLRRLATADTGFQPEGVVVANMTFKRPASDTGNSAATQRMILEGVRSIPGVRSAAMATVQPIGTSSWNDAIYVEGYHPAKEMDAVPWFNAVSEDYFSTLRTDLLAGRDFDRNDTKTSGKVAILNRSAARRYFGDRNPIGATFAIDDQGRHGDPITIVGVVADAKYRRLREDHEPIIYVPLSQDEGTSSPNYIVSSTLAPRAVDDAIAAVAQRVDPRISLRFTVLTEAIAQSVQRERLLAVLSGTFALLAFALSMLGLYGIMAYTVARRRTEIGVRIALGALPSRVMRMVLEDVGRLIAIGIVIGTVGAWFATPLLKSFLFGITANDPRVIGVAMAVLVVGALAAGLIPARRAALLPPTDALRQD